MEDKREIDLEKLQRALEEKISGTAAEGGERKTRPDLPPEKRKLREAKAARERAAETKEAKGQTPGREGAGQTAEKTGAGERGERKAPEVRQTAKMPGGGRAAADGESGMSGRAVPNRESKSGGRTVADGESGMSGRAVSGGESGGGDRIVPGGESGMGGQAVPGGESGSGGRAVPDGESGGGGRTIPDGEIGMGRPTIPDGPRASKKDEASGENGDGEERTKQKGAGPESGKQESKEQESEEREYTGQESGSEADRQAEALARALSAAAIVTEGEEERRRPDAKRQTQSGRRRKRPTPEIPGREAEKTRRRERAAVPGGAKSRESGAEAEDFDDRREETELAAAARSVIVRLDEYRRRIWEARKRRWVRLALVAVLVLGILFGTTQAVKYWTYGSYAVESPASGEDTVSAYYQKVGDRVLKYGLDGVSMTKEDGTALWSAAYTMNAPVAVSCGEAVAIYDSQGTNIRIYNAEGEIGNISTNIPIIKAKVASQGVAAAILESGEETWIQYYSPKGEQIASVKTTLDSTGYPLDLALSEDGLLMAVSYLQIADGTPKTELCFYNFSSIGQNQTDNLANSYTIENVIAPQVEYLDEQTCLLLREDGFSIYEGKQIPKQSEEVKLEQEIISAFHSDSRVGFITKSENAQQAYTLRLFDKRGRELFQEDFDFAYESVFMDERQIVLYNSNQMCVYSLDGVKKFEGDLKEGMVRDILPVGAYQYLLITEEGTCAIRLKR